MSKPTRHARTDWDAAKRDWRTGKFTQVELARKYEINPATLNRKIKSDRAIDIDDWPQDLTEVIRQATNARVTAGMVKKAQAEGQENVKKLVNDSVNDVQVAAEMGANVILRHQTDIGETRDVAMALLAELRGSALLAEHQDLLAEILAGGEEAKPEDAAKARMVVRRALDVGARISSVKALADTLAKLQERERVAFSLDVKDPTPPGPEGGEMGAVDAANRIAFLLASVKDRAK